MRAAIQTLGNNSWAWVLKHALLPMGDVAFGQKLMQRLKFLEEAQWWSPERLAEERDRALASLIRISYAEVPFYRELLDKVRVKPQDIRTQADLLRLPITTKQALRDAYPLTATRSTGKRTFESSTSGSTGINFRFLTDTETVGWSRASFMLALEWAHWTIGEPHIQTGITYNRSIDRRLKDYLLCCHYVPANDLSDNRLDSTLKIMDKHKIAHLWGYPASLFFIAQRAIKLGWNRPLRSTVTWGDNLYPHYRRTIERAFQVQIYDTYGCSEGMQIAAQCGTGSAYHIHSLDTIVEFLDDSGLPAAPGTAGNLVLTRLHPGPMPFIRYRVGDIGVSRGTATCTCGRGHPIMGPIQGRDTDVVLTPSGGRLIVHFFTGILEHFKEIDSFQVVQESLDTIVLRIVSAVRPSSAIADRIIAKLKEMGASDLNIEVVFVDEIPLTSAGKRRFIINKLTGTTLCGPSACAPTEEDRTAMAG